uniref:Uncharacterized protein n=1 Tax=Globodera rostochiensis TaxID=31243 RepID=A0A914GS20_GLORO
MDAIWPLPFDLVGGGILTFNGGRAGGQINAFGALSGSWAWEVNTCWLVDWLVKPATIGKQQQSEEPKLPEHNSLSVKCPLSTDHKFTKLSTSTTTVIPPAITSARICGAMRTVCSPTDGRTGGRSLLLALEMLINFNA